MTTGSETAELKANLKRTQSLAAAFAKRVRAQFGDRVRRIRLYGSAARGDWTPESDVDVLITLDSVKPEDGDWIALESFRMGVMSEGIVLQPIFMDEQEFVRILDRERAFALDVEHTGIPL